MALGFAGLAMVRFKRRSVANELIRPEEVTLADFWPFNDTQKIAIERDAAMGVVNAVRHALEHSVHPVNEEIIQAMREGGFWVGEQKR